MEGYSSTVMSGREAGLRYCFHWRVGLTVREQSHSGWVIGWDGGVRRFVTWLRF